MAISTNTKIAVNANFSRFKYLTEGDIILSPLGKRRTVKKVETENSLHNFVISFSDGSRIYCDSDTLFKLTSKWDRMEDVENGIVMSPKQIMKEEHNFWGFPMKTIYKGSPNPLKSKVHPYVMGLWASGVIKETDIITPLSEECQIGLHERGFPVLNMLNGVDVTSFMLSKHINDMNIQSHSIPFEYLFAPIEDRLELLRGITVMSNKRNFGHYSLTTSNLVLLSNIRSLLASIGVKTTIKRSVYGGSSHYYTVLFARDFDTKNREPDWNQIVSVEPFEQEVELLSLTMGNQHADFSAGDTFIPIHK